MQREVGDGAFVAFKVADERVVVCREVSNCICPGSAPTWRMRAGEPTVLLGAGIDDARARVGELGQFHTVLLAQQALVVAAVLDVVDLDRLVALRRHAQLARVVEVD